MCDNKAKLQTNLAMVMQWIIVDSSWQNIIFKSQVKTFMQMLLQYLKSEVRL